MDKRPLLNDDSLNEQQAAAVPQMKSHTHVFTSFPSSAVDQDDADENYVGNNNRDAHVYNTTNSDQFSLPRPATSSTANNKQQSRLWQFDYYRQYFEVDTKQVLQRLLGSITPRPNQSYFDSTIRQNPDLYGPFWVCVTFIFTIAISGNIKDYFRLSSTEFQIDFSKITLSSIILFLYWWLMPAFVYLFFRWRLNRIEYTYLELLCVYGYSLTIFIPICILWMIQINWLQWLLTIFGSLISGSVLIVTFWPTVSIDQKRVTALSMAAVFLMHTCLAVSIMLVFFHVTDSKTKLSTISTTILGTVATTKRIIAATAKI
ncbi:unnamed protein product [Didymodactylos carnosus]|uniref:Protein YIPF n=1 Tax=Didymodactylos carnosus TaxID=1234261 RepID=A0A813RR82_9BILA|nr:unnamed protein product [Didymodactylos carnosus]CAF3569380.1 unnamed protein product [Didymodactylos carnosus]